MALNRGQFEKILRGMKDGSSEKLLEHLREKYVNYTPWTTDDGSSDVVIPSVTTQPGDVFIPSTTIPPTPVVPFDPPDAPVRWPVGRMIVQPDWRKMRRQELEAWVKAGTLKKTIAPRFDTLIIKPSDSFVQQIAFCSPRYINSKSPADTNMEQYQSLGTPNQAVFQYMRVHFEKYHSLEDAVAWKESAQIILEVGHDRPVFDGSLGAMEPILPKGGHKKIGKMIKTGVIKFWPWYEQPLADIHIDSCDMFLVRVRYKGAFSPKNEMRIKISLGPWLYTP